MVAALLVTVLLQPVELQTGIATTFKPKEQWNNGKFACTGRVPQLPRHWLNASWPVCASRSIPCGTWVWIQNVRTKQESVCLIADRGPYGAIRPDGSWTLRRPRDASIAKYRGVLDMSPSVSQSIDSDGMDRVQIWWARSGLVWGLFSFLLDVWFRHVTEQVPIRSRLPNRNLRSDGAAL